jgi:hypothetical protein
MSDCISNPKFLLVKHIKRHLSFLQLMCITYTLLDKALFLTLGQNPIMIFNCNLKTNGKKS